MRGAATNRAGRARRKMQEHLATYSPDDWRDDAACQGQPSEYFELPDLHGKATDERTAQIQGNLEKGIAICNNCPVKGSCGKRATTDDRRFTVRAGKMPTAFSGRKIGRPRKDGLTVTPVKFPPRRKKLVQWQREAMNEYLQKFDVCQYGHPLLSIDCLVARRNGIKVRVGCRACQKRNNLEYKSKLRAKMEA